MNKEQKILIEDLASECSSLQELGEKLDRTQERARQILHETGIHKRVLEYWKELRDEKREVREKQKEKCLSSIILMLLYETAKREQNSAFQKALEFKYFNEKKQNNYQSRLSLEQLEKLFEICYSGKSYELKEISEKTKISGQRIGEIIREAKVPAPYLLRTRTLLTEEQKKQIKRAKNTELNKQDIAYFLKLPHHAVNTRFKRKRTKSYKIASQVYEAQDLGFAIPEIAELVERSEDRVKRIIKQKPETEPKITEALSILYNKKFEKPYL